MPNVADDPLQLDQQVCFPLYAASNLLIRLYRPALDALGLTYPQYLVMLVLWQQSPLGVGEIGARLYLDSGTLTPLLKRLEVAGFVERRRSADDERRVQVSLTAAGHALRRRAAAIPADIAGKVGLPTTELTRLRRELQRLTAALHRLQSGTR